MTLEKNRFAVFTAVALAFVLAVSVLPANPSTVASARDEASSAVIARYQTRIPELMAEQGVPGLAVVVVDGDRILWAEGFGHLERDGAAPVTTDTSFSVQSTSKVFTATAVMIAVQDGLLELDEPITAYLPEFTVNSVFEEHPERRITLRMLLAHTAGFTHEAPIGNNFDLDPGDFDAHVASISDTWLRFPVGTGYAYSNLGIDLAGFILERVYGRPLAQLMDDVLLDPLGMEHSSFDREVIRGTVDRAVGHVAPAPAVPVDVPMTAAGGLYASVGDLGRFLSFQLSDGAFDGRSLLDPALVAEMRTVPEPSEGASAGYALGVDRTRWVRGRNADLFSHGGGGFGFLSDLWWLPQLELGIAVLTNSSDHQLQGDLALSILSDLTHEPGSAYHERLLALPAQGALFDADRAYRLPANLRERIAEAVKTPTGDDSERWAAYVGEYRMVNWGVVSPMPPFDRFVVEGGRPAYETTYTGTPQRHALTEIEPGLFIADDGETLDLRGSTPTWRNIELVRVSGGPAVWQWTVLAFIGLVAGAWLVHAAVSAVRRRRGDTIGVDREPAARGRWRRVASALAVLTALLTLATIGLLAWIPGLIDSGFIGWLEMPMPLRLALHLPLALTAVGGCFVAIIAVGWAQRTWSGSTRLRLATFALATATFVAQLGAWRLIGWGFA